MARNLSAPSMSINFMGIVNIHLFPSTHWSSMFSSGMRGLPALIWDGSVLDPGRLFNNLDQVLSFADNRLIRWRNPFPGQNHRRMSTATSEGSWWLRTSARGPLLASSYRRNPDTRASHGIITRLGCSFRYSRICWRNSWPMPSHSPSYESVPNHPITSTLDPQAISTPAGPDPDPTSIHGIPDTQPLNSPSLSNIYPSIVIDPSGDESSGRMADLASAGFQGVKTILQLVERAADAFPPLKSTVAGLLGVIDIVEVCDFQLSVVIVMVLTVPRHPLRINEIAKIWSRSWELSSQLSKTMPSIPRRLLSPHVSRVFRRRILSILS